MDSVLTLSGFGVELKTVTIDKIEKIRLWRNHQDIVSNMIDKSNISCEQQVLWFNGLSKKKTHLYLVISYKGEDIGVIYASSETKGSNKEFHSLLNATVVSPGLYIAPECRYKNSILAFSPSLVFIDYLFIKGQCQQLVALVYEKNNSAIRYNEMLGYQKESIDSEGLVTMTLSYEAFQSAKNKLSKILRFNK
jgi:hypothetical protein